MWDWWRGWEELEHRIGGLSHLVMLSSRTRTALLLPGIGGILLESEEPTVFRYKVASSLSRLLDPRLD